MSRSLFGVETEYAVTSFDADGGRVDRAQTVQHLKTAAAALFAHAPDLYGSGVFLSNGSRFYIDCGLHPELATPECTNPTDLVRYVLAGGQTMLRLAAYVRDTHVRGGCVSVFRCNVDYSGSGSTWGCHESYLHRADSAVLAPQIVPHLVTRIIFTGAGGFAPRSPGLELSLSPRVSHIVLEKSTESTADRGIFHTKNEPLCGGGYRRLHVLCGDSACSELSMWLKIGTTALVVLLIEAGVAPGESVRLRQPVLAMKTVAGDLDCGAPLTLKTGAPARAVDIQRHYLEAAESRLGEPFMPAWADDVCRVWRATLDQIDHDRASLTRRFDWAVKSPLYKHYAQQRGFSWLDVTNWTRALAMRPATVHGSGRDAGLQELPKGAESASTAGGEPEPALTRHLREHGLSPDDLPAFVALRSELFEIDTRFGELGDGGVFTALDRSGALAHHVPGVGRVQEAVTQPPAEGRAALRGAVIARMDRTGPYVCDWPWLWDRKARRALDLSDPFEVEERWKEVSTEAVATSGGGPFIRLAQALQDLLR